MSIKYQDLSEEQKTEIKYWIFESRLKEDNIAPQNIVEKASEDLNIDLELSSIIEFLQSKESKNLGQDIDVLTKFEDQMSYSVAKLYYDLLTALQKSKTINNEDNKRYEMLFKRFDQQFSDKEKKPTKIIFLTPIKKRPLEPVGTTVVANDSNNGD